MAVAHGQIVEAMRAAEEAKERAQKERRTRVALEVLSLKPRRVPVALPDGIQKRFREFVTIPVSVAFLDDDAEAEAVARQITNALEVIGFRPGKAMPTDRSHDFAHDGINITHGTGASWTAAQRLEEFFAACLLEASVRAWSPTIGPPLTEKVSLRIVIGRKPETYFQLLEFEEFGISEWGLQTSEQSLLERVERMKQLRKEWFPRKVYDDDQE